VRLEKEKKLRRQVAGGDSSQEGRKEVYKRKEKSGS